MPATSAIVEMIDLETGGVRIVSAFHGGTKEVPAPESIAIASMARSPVAYSAGIANALVRGRMNLSTQ